MTGQALDVPADPLGHLLRELTPQVLGTVVRRFRDFAAAEDAVQEALLAAAMQWPREGQPDNPRAWVTQVAFRRMADHIRSESARRRRESALALEATHTAVSYYPAAAGQTGSLPERNYLLTQAARLSSETR